MDYFNGARSGSAEYFSLMVLGLIASIVMASGQLLHALGMILVGLLLGLVGTDVSSAVPRYTFGMTSDEFRRHRRGCVRPRRNHLKSGRRGRSLGNDHESNWAVPF
jgi:hypothetical protein